MLHPLRLLGRHRETLQPDATLPLLIKDASGLRHKPGETDWIAPMFFVPRPCVVCSKREEGELGS